MENGTVTKCIDCGGEFAVDGSRYAGCNFKIRQCHLPRRCDDCRRRKYEDGKRRQRGALSVHKCAHCGVEFTGRKKTFCSSICRNAAYYAKGVCEKVCASCGKKYASHSSLTSKYCSPACALRENKRKRRETLRENIASVIKALDESHRRGPLAEAMFDAWAIGKGIPCFRSVIECQPTIDRVIFYEGKLQGVQIKAARKVSDCSVGGGVAPIAIRLAGADILAIVSIESNTVVFVNLNMPCAGVG
jgi:hypothetical protein